MRVRYVTRAARVRMERHAARRRYPGSRELGLPALRRAGAAAGWALPGARPARSASIAAGSWWSSRGPRPALGRGRRRRHRRAGGRDLAHNRMTRRHLMTGRLHTGGVVQALHLADLLPHG